jgi:hypothetical protein
METIQHITEATLLDLLAKVTFKETVYIRPHAYIVRAWSEECAAVYDAFAQYIKEAGYSAKFYNRTYRYANVDGYKYWIVDNVLNRERLPEEEYGNDSEG